MDQTYPDPFQEATQHGLQRALQIGASAATAAQVYAYHQKSQARAVSEQDARTSRVLNTQTRAERDAARADWSPALDPQWLRQADLLSTARAWGAAMPYADRDVPWYEPAAATAMRKTEDRLRRHHPYAMAHYDRLRAQGTRPAEAMAEAAPLFARPSHAHDAPMTPRPMLGSGDGTGLSWALGVPDPVAPQPGADVGALEDRGRQILGSLQARARTQGRDPLGQDEQRTVLETITDLPPEVIDRIVEPQARSASVDPGGPGPARNARPWEHDFPVPIQEVVTAAARSTPVSTSTAGPGRAARRTGRLARRRT
jgi:hypothetical protein